MKKRRELPNRFSSFRCQLNGYSGSLYSTCINLGLIRAAGVRVPDF